jgi:hypothetical protein
MASAGRGSATNGHPSSVSAPSVGAASSADSVLASAGGRTIAPLSKYKVGCYDSRTQQYKLPLMVEAVMMAYCYATWTLPSAQNAALTF